MGTVDTSKQIVGRSMEKLKQTMPKSSPLKMKVISALVKSLPPSKKRNIFSDAWKKLSFNPGRPSKVIQTRKV